MRSLYYFTIVILSLASFIFLHELGHYFVALALGLDPRIVLVGDFAEGIGLGVAHSRAGSTAEGLVILGATVMPLFFAVLSTYFASKKGMSDIYIVAEIFILLVLINIIPVPGFAEFDANKLVSILFSS